MRPRNLVQAGLGPGMPSAPDRPGCLPAAANHLLAARRWRNHRGPGLAGKAGIGKGAPEHGAIRPGDLATDGAIVVRTEGRPFARTGCRSHAPLRRRLHTMARWRHEQHGHESGNSQPQHDPEAGSLLPLRPRVDAPAHGLPIARFQALLRERNFPVLRLILDKRLWPDMGPRIACPDAHGKRMSAHALAHPGRLRQENDKTFRERVPERPVGRACSRRRGACDRGQEG